MKRILSILIPISQFIEEIYFILLVISIVGFVLPVFIELIEENTAFFATVQQLVIK